ncbi:hypothetical protein AC1031_013806 [Aphanomyces cochlioides]|nr:hypothetical protein AC1031_013806 [Aphanomyces cochlioides]
MNSLTVNFVFSDIHLHWPYVVLITIPVDFIYCLHLWSYDTISELVPIKATTDAQNTQGKNWIALPCFGFCGPRCQQQRLGGSVVALAFVDLVVSSNDSAALSWLWRLWTSLSAATTRRFCRGFGVKRVDRMKLTLQVPSPRCERR